MRQVTKGTPVNYNAYLAGATGTSKMHLLNTDIEDLENEILGYRKTYEFLNDLPNFINYLPEKSRSFWNLYRKQFSEK